MMYRVRNFFIITALLLAAYLLQYSALIRIPVINCSPNLMLIVTFSFGYIRNRNAGMLVGFFAGLFVDVFYCQVIGYNALVFMALGLICGALKKVYYSDSLLTQISILCACDLVNSLLYYFFWYLLQSKFAFGYCFMNVILPEFIFTLFAGIMLVKPLSALIKKMYIYRSDSEAESV